MAKNKEMQTQDGIDMICRNCYHFVCYWCDQKQEYTSEVDEDQYCDERTPDGEYKFKPSV